MRALLIFRIFFGKGEKVISLLSNFMKRYAKKFFIPQTPPFVPKTGRVHPHKDELFKMDLDPSSCLPLNSDDWSAHEHFLFAIDLINADYFWEAHEVLELVWNRSTRSQTVEGLGCQALIFFCASELKKKQQLEDIAKGSFQRFQEKVQILIKKQPGFSIDGFLGIEAAFWQQDFVYNRGPFITLPLQDFHL